MLSKRQGWKPLEIPPVAFQVENSSILHNLEDFDAQGTTDECHRLLLRMALRAKTVQGQGRFRRIVVSDLGPDRFEEYLFRESSFGSPGSTVLECFRLLIFMTMG